MNILLAMGRVDCKQPEYVSNYAHYIEVVKWPGLPVQDFQAFISGEYQWNRHDTHLMIDTDQWALFWKKNESRNIGSLPEKITHPRKLRHILGDLVVSDGLGEGSNK